MHGLGFVSPYTETRYNLKAWSVSRETPQNPREYFNMVNSKAHNVIERCFEGAEEEMGNFSRAIKISARGYH